MSQQVNQQGIIAKKASEVATRKKPQTLKDWVMSMESQIAKALPKVITPERFTRIALTALSNSPQLAQSDRDSFLGGLMQAAQLGLEPNTPLGQAYLIPYKNNKKGIIECQFQIGYKGLIDLAYRSGEMSSIYAHTVHENDTFEYEYGLEQKMVHKPSTSDRGNAIAYYAVWRLKNGGYGFGVMSVEDIIKHAQQYSQAYKSSYSPWKSSFDEMAKKTVLKAVLKYAPIKTEFILAATHSDEAVVTADDGFELHSDFEVVEQEQIEGSAGEAKEGLFDEEVPFGTEA